MSIAYFSARHHSLPFSEMYLLFPQYFRDAGREVVEVENLTGSPAVEFVDAHHCSQGCVM